MIATAYAVPSVLIFVTSAALILIGALGVIIVKNPVHAALSLIMTRYYTNIFKQPGGEPAGANPIPARSR
jgi:hypothetical protein